MATKSVYNFIPAPEEKEVFKPGWAKYVNHDIPFKDGESGEIELKFTAQTPIFIRNGHSKDNPTNEFSHFKKEDGSKEYFIPATSLKGMIRNVLEIMSFSRLNAENDIFSFRNIDHEDYRADQKKVKAGWLYKEGDKWKITSCSYGQVKIKSIESKKKIRIDGLSAVEKYKVLWENGYSAKRKDTFVKLNVEKPIPLYEMSDSEESIDGNLVVFGSIDNKTKEYVFRSPNNEIYSVSEDLMSRFIEIDTKLPEETSLWKYFMRNDVKKIPVFFVADGKNVKHFGFSKLYKRTNTKRIKELSPISTYKKANKYHPDLASTIFGETNEESGLKGRVFFGHCKAIGNISEMGQKEMILSSPKASFYPFYIKNGLPYSSPNAALAGFKKYPVHRDVKECDFPNENDDVRTVIRPLPNETVFTGKLRFHNLKKIEIGALLSAITFHNNSNSYSHTIGGAKPFGYGKVKIEVTRRRIKYLEDELEDYLSQFENFMDYFCIKKTNYSKWIDSTPIKSLFALSNSSSTYINNELLKYPSLDKGEFGEIEHSPTINIKDVNIESLENNSLKREYERLDSHFKKIEKSSFKEQIEFLKKNPEVIGVEELTRKMVSSIRLSNDKKEINEFLDIFPNYKNDQLINDQLKTVEERELKEKVQQENTERAQHLLSVEVSTITSKDDLQNQKKKLENLKDSLAFLETEINTKISHIDQRIAQIKQESRITYPIDWKGASYEDIKKAINRKYKKKNIQITEPDLTEIENKLEQCFMNECTNKGNNNKFFKRGKFKDNNEHPWTDIVKWLKEERKNALYEKFKSIIQNT